jgi:fructose-1,6-bisphosphatase I/sedoheptulose-1,7-bisphosphatase
MSDLGALLIDVAAAVKTISAMVGKGALAGYHGALDSTNMQGEVQKKLDVLTNEAILHHCEWGGQLAGMASEEMDDPWPIPEQYPRGRYLLIFDPLDGSSNSDVNVSVGTIFSVLTRSTAGDAEMADFLRPGNEQVAAGYAIYGPSTMMVLTLGRGTLRLYAGPRERQFHPDPSRHPRAGRYPRVRHQYLQRTLLGAAGAALCRRMQGRQDRGARRRFQYALDRLDGRRSASHPDARRHLHVSQGQQGSGKPGRLRLMYEANPMAMLIEQAGGSASSTGRGRILEVAPDNLHQRVPVVLGSKNEVERLERYHQEYDAGSDRPFVSPLFSERSLYRDESVADFKFQGRQSPCPSNIRSSPSPAHPAPAPAP